eukprot:1748639-Pleurochrysis_carterae.AAC.2
MATWLKTTKLSLALGSVWISVTLCTRLLGCPPWKDVSLASRCHLCVDSCQLGLPSDAVILTVDLC